MTISAQEMAEMTFDQLEQLHRRLLEGVEDRLSDFGGTAHQNMDAIKHYAAHVHQKRFKRDEQGGHWADIPPTVDYETLPRTELHSVAVNLAEKLNGLSPVIGVVELIEAQASPKLVTTMLDLETVAPDSSARTALMQYARTVLHSEPQIIDARPHAYWELKPDTQNREIHGGTGTIEGKTNLSHGHSLASV